MVDREALGAKAEFERGGYRVRIRIPAHEKEFFPTWDDVQYRAIGGNWSGVVGDPKQRVNVLIVQVAVFGDGPVGAADFDGTGHDQAVGQAITYFQRTFAIAEAVATDLIDWTRVRGQAWLGLHGERPVRVGIDSLIDEDTGHRLPVGFHTMMVVGGRSSAAERAIDSAFVSSLGNLLGDGRPPLPVADTFLADALHFAWKDPTDLPRAILLAAIACEVKVKEVLREKTASQIRPMVDVLLENPRDWSLAAASLFDKVMAAALGHSLRDENKALYKRIDNLFQLRNRIVHKGEKPKEFQEAKDAVDAAGEVFAWLNATPGDIKTPSQ